MEKSVTIKNSIGLRLEEFLEKRFPGESHASKSRKFGFPNTTVIEWESGRTMPEKAYQALIELGCDLNWLLTGVPSLNAPSAPANSIDSRLLQLCEAASYVQQAFQKYQLDALQGKISIEEFGEIIQAASRAAKDVQKRYAKKGRDVAG